MDNDILEGRKGNGSLAEWYLMCSSNRLFFIGRVREDKINPHTDGVFYRGQHHRPVYKGLRVIHEDSEGELLNHTLYLWKSTNANPQRYVDVLGQSWSITMYGIRSLRNSFAIFARSFRNIVHGLCNLDVKF